MKRITKKQFINTLSENESIFIFAPSTREDHYKEIIAYIDNFKLSGTLLKEKRNVTSVTDRKVTFNNSSCIDFTQKGNKEYFSYRNFIVLHYLYGETNQYFLYYILEK